MYVWIIISLHACTLYVSLRLTYRWRQDWFLFGSVYSSGRTLVFCAIRTALPVLPYIAHSTSELRSLQWRLCLHLKLPVKKIKNSIQCWGMGNQATYVRTCDTYSCTYVSPVYYQRTCAMYLILGFGYYLVFNSSNKSNPNHPKRIKANRLDTWNWNSSCAQTGSAGWIAQKTSVRLPDIAPGSPTMLCTVASYVCLLMVH